MSGIASASLFARDQRAPRRQEESLLQQSVHQFLGWAEPGDAVHFAIPNGLMRSKRAAARAQGEGVLAGVPDLLCIWGGRPIFLELKSARGTRSAAQRNVHRKLAYCGAPVFLCRSLNDVEAALRGVGVPLQATVSGWLTGGGVA